MKSPFLWWVIIWTVIAIIAVIATGSFEALLGIGIAALISLIFMVKNLNEVWEGVITDIKKERVMDSDDDGISYSDVTFTYVKLTNGKIKKLNYMKEWQIGDTLIKRKGTSAIEHKKAVVTPS